jgi:uncharacterized cupredoxin-like copper-binding protein
MRISIIRRAILVILFLVSVTACQSAPAPSQITVSLKEWGIEPKAMTVKAGKVTFTVKNAGTLEHNFIIQGSDKIDSIFAAQSKTFEVTLAAGTYIVDCNLSGHKEAGMTATLTVVP